jgi:hypothetical protein
MGNQYLSLGLFIMLLSFFIVLNSMSRFEETKTVAVIKSLSNALVPQYSLIDDLPSPVIAPEGEDKNAGDGLDQIDALFRSTIPDIKAQKSRFGTTLRMQMDRETFEAALHGEGEDARRFARSLVGVVESANGGPYEMDIILTIDVPPARLHNENPAAAEALVNKAGNYTQLLEETGLPPFLMTAGLGYGVDDAVFLLFRKYEPLRLEPKAIESEGEDE